MIEARLPDGTALQFPDGTPDAAIDKAVQSHLSTPAAGAPAEIPNDPDRPLPPPDEYGIGGGVSSVVSAPPTAQDIRGGLQKEPGWVYSEILPIRTKEVAPGQGAASAGWNFTLPGMLRNPLLGLMEGPQNAVTINPNTGTLGLTPEAASVAPFAASPLRMGRPAFQPPGTFDRPAPLSSEFRQNPMTPEMSARPVEPAPSVPASPTGIEPPPAPMPLQPAPSAAGAAPTPPTQALLTPAEEQAYRSTAEGQKWLERQMPGEKDTTAYVNGVSPNAAEIEQTVNTAREMKALNITAPKVSQEAQELAAANNDARTRHWESIARSPVDVNNVRTARATQAEADLKATWANKTDADASGVVDVANQVKASPDGRRPLVRNAVDSVTKELFDDQGRMITDPEQLYGVRKHLDDLMSKEAAADDPKNVRAVASLQKLKDQLDTVIEASAPGFRQYLKNFSDASRKIDEMEVLQGHERKLYDAQGRMGFNRVQQLMRNIVDSRAADGINPYKSITDETMQKLWALRDDLRRSASAQELARTPGSDTTQNLVDMAKRGLARGAGGGVGGAVGAAFGGGPGAVAGADFGRRAMDALLSRNAERRAERRGMDLLYPKNQLSPP